VRGALHRLPASEAAIVGRALAPGHMRTSAPPAQAFRLQSRSSGHAALGRSRKLNL